MAPNTDSRCLFSSVANQAELCDERHVSVSAFSEVWKHTAAFRPEIVMGQIMMMPFVWFRPRMRNGDESEDDESLKQPKTYKSCYT